MTLAHISHFGLKEIGRSSTGIVFEGTRADCLRMAFAHGMEIEKLEGRFRSSDDGRGYCEPADPAKPAYTWFKGGGLIHRGRDLHCFVMPLAVWLND